MKTYLSLSFSLLSSSLLSSSFLLGKVGMYTHLIQLLGYETRPYVQKAWRRLWNVVNSQSLPHSILIRHFSLTQQENASG